MLLARNGADLAQVAGQLAPLAGMPGQLVCTFVGDVCSEQQCAAALTEAARRFGKLDILVNNAGVYGPMGPSEDVDFGQWVRAIETNLLGPVLMCRMAIPLFKAQKRGKIINLAGGGATAPMPWISAYAASKAAIVRFTETLALELREYGIDVNAVAPGALNTQMLQEVLAAGPAKVGQAFYDRSLKQLEDGGAGLTRGAGLVTFLASAASDGVTGRLISAVWDDWSNLPAHAGELAEGDIYTLRRIVPRDRGKTWT